jgi:arylsulfatase A-like enzyme
VRVPFIAAWAKANASNQHQQRLPIAINAIQPQLASVTDIFPTILSLIDIQPPANHVVDGQSLANLMQGKLDPNRKQSFLMHYPHAPHRSNYWTSFRDGDWKVIYHYFPTEVSGGSHYQLFNLNSDPFEQADLASQEPKVLQKMMQELAEALEVHHAVYPVDENGVAVKPVAPNPT